VARAARPGAAGAGHRWLSLALVPLLGSLVTEPAAMTLAALLLAPLVFRPDVPEWLKYVALGVLFVNVSIGGTLTSFAAPPVLMVAATWHWDSAFMATTFGWRAALAVALNASFAVLLLRAICPRARRPPSRRCRRWSPPSICCSSPAWCSARTIRWCSSACSCCSSATPRPTRAPESADRQGGAAGGFFLAGLVVLGGMQQWWLQPLVTGLSPHALFFGALGLTAITDNAALTYLGSLMPGMSAQAQYMLMAGAVGGGGLTVIANAPNPAGAALLRGGFDDEAIGAGGLLLGALAPTAVAAGRASNRTSWCSTRR
jgi:hypothetical protein